MRAVCIARHRYLSDHICSLVQDADVDATPVVGFEEGMHVARTALPDVVLCEYDLLVTAPLNEWEEDPQLSRVPVIAVSLTRRPDESHLLDTNGIAGFLYLPMLTREMTAKVVRAATAGRIRPAPQALRWDTRQPQVQRAD
jgi:hypothetical protein